VQLATTGSRLPILAIPEVLDARSARPVQNSLMQSIKLWDSTDFFLVMYVTQPRDARASFPWSVKPQNTPLYQQLEPKLQLIDAGKNRRA
jgi:hypothetical protein